MSSSTLVGTRILTEQGQKIRRVRGFTLRYREGSAEEKEARFQSSAVRVGSREGNELLVKDSAMSRAHFEIIADENGFRLRDLGSTNGTFVDGYRVLDVYLHAGSRIDAGESRFVFDISEQEYDVPARADHRFGPLVGSSLPMRELFSVLERAAESDATVLLLGETGTGKELAARAVHAASSRCGGPFVVFDCGAVTQNLIESELFGHEKGAFTGATERRVGRFEEADGGTLFIDELGELPLELQPKLLRALERREVRRLGGREIVSVDVRIVAATHRDLNREVIRGAFREDLYYRLAVVRVAIPPLRERVEDIPLLIDAMVRQSLQGEPGRAHRILATLQNETLDRLKKHRWPGNVRELRNVVERTLALSQDDEVEPIRPATSPPRAAQSDVEIDLETLFVDHKAKVVAAFEKRYLAAQLDRHDGNISRAAAASGIDRMYFKRLLRKYQ